MNSYIYPIFLLACLEKKGIKLKSQKICIIFRLVFSGIYTQHVDTGLSQIICTEVGFTGGMFLILFSHNFLFCGAGMAKW